MHCGCSEEVELAVEPSRRAAWQRNIFASETIWKRKILLFK
jgi:hypothetical protein